MWDFAAPVTAAAALTAHWSAAPVPPAPPAGGTTVAAVTTPAALPATGTDVGAWPVLGVLALAASAVAAAIGYRCRRS